METITEVWNGVLQYLHDLQDISETGFQSWITCIRPVAMESDRIVVSVHTDFQRDIISTHYADKIRQAILQVVGLPLSLQILTDTEMQSSEDEAVTAAEEEEDSRNFVQRSVDNE